VKKLFVLTLVLVMGLSSFAFAADNEASAVQTGDGNAAHITQEGDSQYAEIIQTGDCLLYTSPSPRDRTRSRMPSSA